MSGRKAGGRPAPRRSGGIGTAVISKPGGPMQTVTGSTKSGGMKTRPASKPAGPRRSSARRAY